MGFDKLSYMWTAILPLVVLLYYFFRKRYVTRTISSTMFWEQSMRETKVSPYLKNLQRNALFYLQMAALLLLLFALLGPYLNRADVIGNNTVIIVDTSATMLASKEGMTLFERNRQLMKEMVSNRDGLPVTIIATGKEPRLVVREETDVEKVLAAINKLAIIYEHENMDLVVEFTRSIVSSSDADIHIYTDSYDRSGFLNENSSNSWTVHGSEENYSNLSIDKFGAVKTPEGTEAVIKIVNQSAENGKGKVEIKDGLTGEILTVKPFSIEAGKDLYLSMKNLPTSRSLHATIIVEDDYIADNDAFVLLGNEITEAIVDNNLHELVKRAFESVGVIVTSGSAKELTAAEGSALIITNDVSLYRNSSDPVILIGRNDKTSKPVSGVVDISNDPLFTVVEMRDIYVSELYPPFKGLKTIATIEGKPFIQKSDRGDIIVLTDIELTDWPLHPSFPLFAWSAAQSLQSEGGSLGIFNPNERKALLTSGIAKELEIFSAEDEYMSTFSNGSSFIAPSIPGIYKLMGDSNREKLFTVQLEKSEKEILKGDSYRIGNPEEVKGAEEGKRNIVWIILLPVLLLLLIEWEVQRRRGYPN